ncbi:hypothetical protein ABK040_006426 [Willaertia magna]
MNRTNVLFNNNDDPFYGSNAGSLNPNAHMIHHHNHHHSTTAEEYVFQPIRTEDDHFFSPPSSTIRPQSPLHSEHSRTSSDFDVVDYGSIDFNNPNSRPTSPLAMNTTTYTNTTTKKTSNNNSLEPVVDEVPLLEELGINFKDIYNKSMFILNPFSKERRKALHSMMLMNDPYNSQQTNFVDGNVQHVLKDMDVAGPLMFCLALGFTLLLKGKIHFNYIYGVVVVGCLSVYLLLNLMCPLRKHMELQHVISILGYGLLPMVFLGLITATLPLLSSINFVLSWVAVLWSTYSASTMFVAALGMSHQRLLVGYPIGLVYATFALITVM